MKTNKPFQKILSILLLSLLFMTQSISAASTSGRHDAYVPLRHKAYSFGASVEWHSPGRSVHITDINGNTHIVVVDEVGGFVEHGTTWVPLEFAEEFFASFPAIPALTRQDFIYDFDYMFNVLTEEFLYFGIVYRRLGIDMHQLASDTRAIIEDEDVYIDADIFWDIMHENFFEPINLIGHLRILSNDQFHARAPGIRADTYNPNNYALKSPATIAFYAESSSTPYELLAAYRGGGQNIVFETIEENRIAHMTIHSMLFYDIEQFTADQMYAFENYGALAGYEHLIVDLRGNPGGAGGYFNLVFLGAFFEEIFEVPMYALFSMGGHYSHSQLEFIRGLDFTLGGPEVDLDAVPHLQEDNTELFVFAQDRIQRTLGPVQPLPVLFGEADLPEERFEGKIWLLIDGYTFSAGEMAAIMADATGSISIVGEQARGGMGTGFYSWVSLPNSGIIMMFDVGVMIDQYGRAFEEFPFTPHYTNKHGLDALETVLRMITEGIYE